MKIYELIPTNGRKSFYGKARVHRLYDGWTQTTGNHIKSFCGLNKAEFTALPLY